MMKTFGLNSIEDLKHVKTSNFHSFLVKIVDSWTKELFAYIGPKIYTEPFTLIFTKDLE